MTDTDARLIGLLDEELRREHPEFAQDWEITESQNFRVQSPVEPCNLCGRRVYLILPNGQNRPYWVQLGEVCGADTLFPSVRQIIHKCGNGDSWSVEAALFVESALAEWGVIA